MELIKLFLTYLYKWNSKKIESLPRQLVQDDDIKRKWKNLKT